MRILVLNGSPKGEKSNTMKLTNSFLEGIGSIEKKIEKKIIDIGKFDINPCHGCFSCWEKTPGSCIIKDDMGILLKKYIEADLIIWSFPLYCYGMPSKIKAFMDRMLPLNLPYIENTDKNSGNHPSRYDMSDKNYVLISTCGFQTINDNYESLFQQFRIIYGEKFIKITSPQGELFRVPELKVRTDKYLSYVFEAGKEFATKKEISSEVKAKLAEQLYPTDTFLEMANTHWKTKEGERDSSSIETKKKALRPMKLMTTVYNSKNLKKEGIIFEFNFVDISEKYQLKLFKDRCEFFTENFEEYTTKIEVTFDLWQKISKGEVDGAQALMGKKYRVLGDLSLMTEFGSYFSSNSKEEKNNDNTLEKKKTSMVFNFIPWIPFWIFSGMTAAIGGVLVTAGINLFSEKFKLTIYDKINMTAVSVLSVVILYGIKIPYFTTLTYLIFVIIWGGSTLTKIPLTAYYSINDYEDSLFNNPLFLKTNKILTSAWSLVYLIAAINGYWGINFGVNSIYVFIINTILFVSMLSFTKWFAKWYPQKIAQGKI